MTFIQALHEGDKFRPAHASQVSLNRRQMPRTEIYKITKVYPQSPYYTISVMVSNPKDGIYSLGPRTPVIRPKAPLPLEADILEFLKVKNNREIVGYKLLWDGTTDLSGRCAPQAAALVKMMFAFGKGVYEARELHAIANRHLSKFLNGRELKRDAVYILRFYRRHLVSAGLIEEIVDDAPTPEQLLDAGLGGT